jgi:Plasmid pRiA4b ORF-3-like protein
MPRKGTITLAEAVAQVVSQLDGPLSLDEFIARVLAIHPSQARNPSASVRNHLRWEEVGSSVAYLDPQTVMPLRIAMQGVRFHIPLSRPELNRKVLFADPPFRHFLRSEIPYDQMRLLDEAGRTLPTKAVTIKQREKGPFGPYEHEIPALDLGEWFVAHRARATDGVLVTINDWETACFQLEYEPARERRKHRREIEEKNQELADLIYGLLENARSSDWIFAGEAVTTAYARMSDPRGYPGDHWLLVVYQDRRMKTNGMQILYAESFTPLEAMVSTAYEEASGPPEEPFRPSQGRQVYRLKVARRRRPDLWRRIEIQGKQTLADLNATLVDAFDYDGDHMGGFWRRVRRGSGKRYREVDLGDVDPFGEGSGAGRRVAGLGLKPGDTLQYVYDFGDWIEHLVTLEEVGEAVTGVDYPCVVESSGPRAGMSEEQEGMDGEAPEAEE